MMKRFLAFCLALMLVICAVPTPKANAAEITATVKGGWLVLRASPSLTAAALDRFYTGTKVTILGSSGSWYRVKVAGKTGYMLGSYLRLDADTGSSNAPAGNLNITAYIVSANGGSVRMRRGPSTSYGVIRSYPVGTKVTILAKGDYWFQISVNGTIGYMMSQYLTTTAPGSSGGTTPTSPSTSGGYTAYVWSQNGRTVNLRSGPSKGNDSLGSYAVGTQLTVLQEYNKTWYFVRVGTRTGYMMSEFITTTAPGTSGGTVTPPTTGGYTAYVTSADGKGVNMRTGPSTSYRSLGLLPVGTQVTVLQHGARWDYIRFGTTDCYMDNTFLTTIAPEGGITTPPVGGYTATVVASSGTTVNMRDGASKGNKVLAKVPLGSKVTVISVTGLWAYINYNNMTGYMMTTYLIKDATTEITGVTLSSYSVNPGDVLSATVTPEGATVTYAWVDGSGNVLGTEATYTVKETDTDKEIALRVTGYGAYSGNVISPAAGVSVTESHHEITGVSLNGNVTAPKVGDTLTAAVEPTGATAAYAWYRSGSDEKIGDSSAYTVKAEDVGHTLHCVVTGAGDYAGTVNSSETGTVTVETTKIVSAAISGTAKVNETLTVAVQPEGATVTYSWQYAGTSTVIGTDASYQVKEADIGKAISCTVTGTGNYAGTITTASTATVVTNQVNLEGIDIAGTPIVGHTLTAEPRPKDAKVTYAWYRSTDGKQVSTSSSYTLTAEDVGATFSCMIIGIENYVGSYKSVETSVVLATEPTTEPTAEPTDEPTTEPTTEPTVEPTTEPTTEPTVEPTTEPTTQPQEETKPEETEKTESSEQETPSEGAGTETQQSSETPETPAGSETDEQSGNAE